MTIECQADSQLNFMYWYRQLPGQSLVLMATANQGSKATYESEFTEDKFPISRPNLAFSTLTVSNASSEDSSSYFCSAGDTVLGTDQGSQQEPLSLPPSSQPACGISVPQPGIEPLTLLWKCGVVTTGSPRKSLCRLGLTSCYPGVSSNTISPERAFLTFYAHTVPVDSATSYSHLLSLYPISLRPNYQLVQFSSVAQSCPTLRPHGLQPARLPCPSPNPRSCSNSHPSSQ
uniref:Ig-like domain-containing protein n=1 Tax=Capra hircus TaxID=9925 RepID=A0A452DV74_CAPHI